MARFGDGRDAVLAGGTLLSAEGEPIWRHDRAGFLNTLGGRHYDAALIGHYAVYVVDGRTGRTRMHHQVGHAQWALPCKVRDDLPGTEIMVGTRWGNYGIPTRFSGRGDRLWSIHLTGVPHGATPAGELGVGRNQ